MVCPNCGCDYEVKNQENYSSGPDYMDYDEESSKKSALEDLMGLSNEARKNQLPKKGMVSIEMMKIEPKKKK